MAYPDPTEVAGCVPCKRSGYARQIKLKTLKDYNIGTGW